MYLHNFLNIGIKDTVKFVVSDMADLNKANQIINDYTLTDKCRVYISPVFGKIQPEQIVNFMIDNKLNDVNMQLQMHKIIWDPDKRGV
jgi:7-carboxy-7-deazaguanine synthase